MISPGSRSTHGLCIPTQSITLLASSFRDISGTQKSMHLQRSMYCKSGRLNPSSYLSRRAPEAWVFRLVLQPLSCATSTAAGTCQSSVGLRCQGTVMLNTLLLPALWCKSPSRDGPARKPQQGLSSERSAASQGLLSGGMRSQRLLWSLSSRSLPLLWKCPQVFI